MSPLAAAMLPPTGGTSLTGAIAPPMGAVPLPVAVAPFAAIIGLLTGAILSTAGLLLWPPMPVLLPPQSAVPPTVFPRLVSSPQLAIRQTIQKKANASVFLLMVLLSSTTTWTSWAIAVRCVNEYRRLR